MLGREIIKHLRIRVMIAWVIAWNILGGLSIWIGGERHTINSFISNALTLTALLGTSCVALAIIYSATAQAVTLRASDSIQGLRKELWFIAVLTAGLAVAQIVALI